MERVIMATFTELPEVINYDVENPYKFIVAKLIDSDNVRIIVRSASEKRCKMHRDILTLLQQEIRDMGLVIHCRCIGGGYINIDHQEKKITIYSGSGDFGIEPNREHTVRMLQAAFPLEYQIHAEL